MEITAFLAVLSAIVAVVAAVLNIRRNQKSDDSTSGREIGSLLTEVGYIKSSIDSLNRKLDLHEERYTKLAERIAAVEQGAKSAHHRIDALVKDAIQE
jgi:peptidoglycan hydrolase CwlO-like protein